MINHKRIIPALFVFKVEIKHYLKKEEMDDKLLNSFAFFAFSLPYDYKISASIMGATSKCCY